MQLVFLGSGGGRIILDKQILATGGFRINSADLKMHVDPGPGAFVKSLLNKQEPGELNALFVSHAHIDHCNDANMLIEAMNFGNYRGKKGVLLGSESVVNGFEKFEKQIDEYFKGMLHECKSMRAGECHEFSENAHLRAVKTDHEDPSAIGFVLSLDGINLGYTSDTDYFDGIAAQFEGCDFIIFNCLRPNDDGLRFHFTAADAVKTVNEMVRKPKAIFITHMGMKFLQAGADAQRRLIEEKTGVPTIIAKEGLSIDLSTYSGQQKLL
ncbi:MAG: MBL fold metallo-hydrolase [Candidatus Micrarchaeota archaeon]